MSVLKMKLLELQQHRFKYYSYHSSFQISERPSFVKYAIEIRQNHDDIFKIERSIPFVKESRIEYIGKHLVIMLRISIT